jgi:site-specific DNA-methyltransferase (adenine-specific)
MNETLKVSTIVVAERLRKDYGDLGDLDTIATVGLIQPIVVDRDADGTHRLVAGGRRLAKVKELGIEELHHGVTSVSGVAGYVYSSELPEDVRRECELYENIGRKQMSWQERVLAIAEIHTLKKNRAALDGEHWGQRETGAEVGMTYANVSYALMIAAALKDPESPVWDCKGVTDAIRWFVEQRENIANKQKAELTVREIPHVVLNNLNQPVTAEGVPVSREALTVPLSQMLRLGDMVELAKEFPESADHIVTDWPYGINLEYLEQGQGMDVSRVDAEHDFRDNINNFPLWIQAMWTMLKDKSYCVVWYDNVHWTLMRGLAEQAGFRVQRWPLVWVKTSPCLNQMASKNWTKATEFAMVLSKGNATILKPQPVNYWSGPRADTKSNPFAKPKALWQWILDAFALPGDVIVDPFMGQGSAALASIDFGCRFVGFEINENHFNQARNDVMDFYKQLTQNNVQFT